jgi:hypothetical protein
MSGETDAGEEKKEEKEEEDTKEKEKKQRLQHPAAVLIATVHRNALTTVFIQMNKNTCYINCRYGGIRW